ncbi:MAG: ABC transporter ATP-binding protein [Candidatus Omnitrophota bacterium]
MKVIWFKDVSEMYRIKFSEEGKTYWDDFWPLQGISFEVEEGQTVGIIGANGSGKSTILKLISGMLKPDKGEVVVQGKASGLLELGAGFEPEMTGRENIYTLAALYGLNREQVKSKFKEITEFADIGRFINAPVKCYSQGMFVRLAFAIAINMNTKILLIDDTLAVGDEYFQRKCIKKIFELKEQGKTIVLVTHDMNMLNRLCKRAIFLKEGRIVKDDTIDKVIPLYTQMTGVKEGIGMIGKDNFNLIFNNGRLFLNWDGKLLTPDPGAYTAFFTGNKWYSSLQADWEVKKETENKLVATGKFYQLAVTQIWQLELSDDCEIKWDVEVESEEPIEIREGYINIILTSEYTNWFTPLERGEFPLIDDKIKNWQPLLEDNLLRKCIGVEARNDSGDKLPALAFENSHIYQRIQAQIFNTDYLANSRVLQYKTMCLGNYSENQANRFVYFSGKLAVGILGLNNYLEKLQDEFIISNGKSQLIFNNGQCVLSHNSLPVTKANHIIASIHVNGKRYFSNSARWRVKKEGKDKLVATGTWGNLPIEQIWEIEVNNNSSLLLCKINLRINKEVDIQEQNLEFMFQPSYTYWFGEYVKGSFPEDFLEVDIDMMQRCISDGYIGIQSHNNKLPTIYLHFSKKLGNFAKILNSNFYDKARIMRIDNVQPEQNIKFIPGIYPSFLTEIVLNEDKRVRPEDLANILEYGKLKLVFDNGRGRIYWDSQEITKRLGLYTSLRSQGRWYDSASSTLWKTEAKTDDTIEVSGKWLHLPIHQYWKMRLTSDKLIEFIVTMKVNNNIEIDRLQTNIMLSERYNQWFANDEKRIFPQFNPNIDDDWDVLWSGFADSEKNKAHIGVEREPRDGAFLPTVIFSPQEITPQYMINVVNSDIYHRGRVLQYLKKEQEILLIGEYIYYQGKIGIKDF